MVTNLLPYILTIALCGQWNIPRSEPGCLSALAWVTIARDSESDYPIYPVVQFRRIRAGHLWCQINSSLTELSLSVSNGSYC